MIKTDILDSEGIRLPIKIDSTSNGEYEPIPISKTLPLAIGIIFNLCLVNVFD